MTFLLGTWLQAMRRNAAIGARTRRGANRKRPHPIVPRLEALEDRWLPSTLTVTSTADGGAGSLRAAIATAQSGDIIAFAPSLSGQTITLTSGELAITQSLNIEGPGANQLTISGNNASRVFDISGTATDVAISGLTIADGLADTTTATGPFGNVTLGGGLLNTGAHVTLSGVAFADNQANGTQTGYVQTNLVSDIPGLAQITDPNLKDPWGIAESATGPFSIADQKASVATAYSVTPAGVSALPAQTIAVPITTFGKDQGPSGQVFNDTNSFLVNGAPATFIFADLNGAIYAWNGSLGTTAQIEAVTTGALYSGLDIESTASGDFLYAANPRQDRVDVFDGSFQPVNLGAGAFVDPQLPTGLVPFNVEGVNGDIYVAYTVPGPAHYVAPEGVGAVAVFDASGNFLEQLIAGGELASPWGIVLAPPTFGQFGGDLLVGNFSYADPAINAFDPTSGAYLGTLTDGSGNTLLRNGQGIWDMTFGNGGNGGLPNTLYVTTGLNAPAGVNAVAGNDGSDGLFVAIDALPGIAEGGAVANLSGGTLEVSHCTFTDNRAVGNVSGSSGAIANEGGSTLVLDHSAFTDNQAITLLGAGPGIQGSAFSGAVSNSGGSQATLSYCAFEGNSAHGGNGADGTATAPNGGNAGSGVGGAIGNHLVSLVGPFASLTMAVDHSTFLDNRAIGGTGGSGAAGGSGGNGSAPGLFSTGGAIVNDNSTLTVSHSAFLDNEAIGGRGGAGGADGNGGAGGASAGGAITSNPAPPAVTGASPVRATLLVSDSVFLGNEAIGGAGGAGGVDGNGGTGGAGLGGALRTAYSDWDVSDSVFVGNQVVGGAGGDPGSGGSLGGAGGAGQGGALANLNGSIGTVIDSVFIQNAALGGAGGNGQGGGIFNGGPSPFGSPRLTLQGSTVVNNEAIGGAAGLGGSDG
jgi:uncharacterized protein (TIGR03118 family)